MNKQRSGALHLTQKVDYALMLLICLAKSKESISIKQIADEKNLSFSFLQKIARDLVKANIIKAERGKYGGYKLKKDPRRLTIKEVIIALEGPIAIVPCLSRSIHKPPCFSKKCEIKLGLKKINNEIEKFLGSKTLNEIIS